MSATDATYYVRRMIEREGPDAERSMERLEAKYGIGFWTLDHFRRRKAKTCDVALFQRIQAAFVDHCGRQQNSLQRPKRLKRCGQMTMWQTLKIKFALWRLDWKLRKALRKQTRN